MTTFGGADQTLPIMAAAAAGSAEAGREVEAAIPVVVLIRIRTNSSNDLVCAAVRTLPAVSPVFGEICDTIIVDGVWRHRFWRHL
jgi:hypothetical protein